MTDHYTDAYLEETSTVEGIGSMTAAGPVQQCSGATLLFVEHYRISVLKVTEAKLGESGREMFRR